MGWRRVSWKAGITRRFRVVVRYAFAVIIGAMLIRRTEQRGHGPSRATVAPNRQQQPVPGPTAVDRRRDGVDRQHSLGAVVDHCGWRRRCAGSVRGRSTSFRRSHDPGISGARRRLHANVLGVRQRIGAMHRIRRPAPGFRRRLLARVRVPRLPEQQSRLPVARFPLVRRTLPRAVGALMIAALCGAMPAITFARQDPVEPRLLASAPDDNRLRFAVRPRKMQLGPTGVNFEFFVGPGATAQEFNDGKPIGRIRWLRWGHAAVGQATDLHIRTNRSLLVHATSSSQATLRAWRVRARLYRASRSPTAPGARTCSFCTTCACPTTADTLSTSGAGSACRAASRRNRLPSRASNGPGRCGLVGNRLLAWPPDVRHRKREAGLATLKA